METTTNTARLLPEVRAALKKQQHARHAAKRKMAAGEIEPHEYSAMFASQPEQVAKAKAQAAERAARNKVKSAAVQAALTNAEGGAEAFGGVQ